MEFGSIISKFYAKIYLHTKIAISIFSASFSAFFSDSTAPTLFSSFYSPHEHCDEHLYTPFQLSVGKREKAYQRAKKNAEPYLLPQDHPIKPLLDQIFALPNTCFNFKSLKAAGFFFTKPRKYTRLIIARHPHLPGYIFKLYLDVQAYHSDMPEYHFWILRIQGAEKIRSAIKQKGIGELFKVPKKWIYLLPQASENQTEGYYPKYSVLVEEEMELYSNEENRSLWKSSFVSNRLLNELYALLEEIGLNDCLKPDNIPFARDGRIAFIDTQSFGQKEIRYSKLLPYLSEENQTYWKNLCLQRK